MKLHHTTGRPDWANIRPEARNFWQRFAVATKSIGTPGNLVSLAGLLTVGYGIWVLAQGSTAAGMWLIIIGRFCDIVDGFVADHTGTKSPLGGAVDATFDKLGALAILAGAGIAHVIPLWVILLIVIQNGANSIIAYRGWRQKLQLQPVLSGKLSTALQWLSVSCFLAAKAYGDLWSWPAYILLVPALLLGFISSRAYAQMVSPGKASTAHSPVKN